MFQWDISANMWRQLHAVRYTCSFDGYQWGDMGGCKENDFVYSREDFLTWQSKSGKNLGHSLENLSLSRLKQAAHFIGNVGNVEEGIQVSASWSDEIIFKVPFQTWDPSFLRLDSMEGPLQHHLSNFLADDFIWLFNPGLESDACYLVVELQKQEQALWVESFIYPQEFKIIIKQTINSIVEFHIWLK